MFSNIKKLSVDGINLVELYINGNLEWKSGPKNWVKYSTEADGVTIYNGGLGYKDGYRVRSGGAEQTTTDTACTGFIPFKKGDVLRIYPAFAGQNIVNAINFANADRANIGQMTGSGSAYGICTYAPDEWKSAVNNNVNGVTVIDMTNISRTDDVAYVRITNCIAKTSSGYKPIINSGAEMIVTINEEIE